MLFKKSLILLTLSLLTTGFIDKIIKKKSTTAVATDNSEDTGGGGSTNPSVVVKAYGVLFKTTATVDGGFAYGDGNYPGY